MVPRDRKGRSGVTPTSNLEAIRDWLHLLYKDAPGYVSVVTLPSGGPASFFATDELDRAAVLLARKASFASTYVSCCTVREPLGDNRRGGVDDAHAVVGLWSDLDIAGPGHKWGEEADARLRCACRATAPRPSPWSTTSA